MTARMVNAIPTANPNLAGFDFGAMYPPPNTSTLLVLVPSQYQLPSGEGCELLHTSLVVQKMMGYSESNL
jgi:hypothetical protein